MARRDLLSLFFGSFFVAACASGIEAHPEDGTGAAGDAGASAAGEGGAGGGSSGAATAGTATAGTGTSGSGTAGSGTSGSGTAGSGTAGSGTAGSGTAGSGTSGSGTSGSGTAGSGTSGSGTSGSGTSGSGTAGSGTAGSGTAGSGTSGSGTSGSGTAGSGTSGSGTAGSGTSGSGTAGTGTSGAGTGGTSTAGTGGTSTAGTGGTSTAGTGGTSTAGSSGSGGSSGDPCTVSVAYDFEPGAQGFTHNPTSGISGDDPWKHGTSAGGIVCHGGTKCFATGLTSAGYSDCQMAELVSPMLDLSACAASPKTVTLRFFHTYDFEVMSSGKWWDGGLLQVSGDGGATWADAVTSQAYQGTIQGSYSGCNPVPDVKGHAGWSGKIPGGTWTEVTYAVPAMLRTATFRFRFLMGADAATTSRGWGIDDVSVVAQ